MTDTIVFFHADPDDEAIFTGGSMPLLADLGPHSLVIYDEGGIYEHPGHVQVHRVGHAASTGLPVETVYECTVDREYLDFVESHLVVEAALTHRPETLFSAAGSLGSATVEIDVAVDVAPVLDRKRDAMAARGSQIPESSRALQLPGASLSAVYGREWECRVGPPGPLERLTT